jgi:signal peptidase I
MTPAPRKPWLAVVLALLCPGLGHVYCGRLVRGVAFAVLSLSSVPVAVVVASSPPHGGLLVTLLAVCAASIAVILFAIFDAWRISQGSPADFVPKSWQRPAVYALFVALGALCPTGSAVVLEHGVLAAYKIAGGSMQPALAYGDRILANKMAYSYGPVRRGDVVVFEAPGHPGVVYAKRIVGLPGERVGVSGGGVTVNGRSLLEDTPSPDGARFERDGARRWQVVVPAAPDPSDDVPEKLLAQGTYLVLGDSRSVSLDSRSFGPVSRDAIFGRVDYVVWSAGGVGAIGAVGEDGRR